MLYKFSFRISNFSISTNWIVILYIYIYIYIYYIHILYIYNSDILFLQINSIFHSSMLLMYPCWQEMQYSQRNAGYFF